MKFIIWAIVGLGLCSCKIDENDTTITEETVYIGSIKTENLEYLGLMTRNPVRNYDLNITSQTLTISNSACSVDINLTSQELASILYEISQTKICEVQSNVYCDQQPALITNSISYYYKNAIDPDYLILELPRRCVINRGACEENDITKSLALAERYSHLFNCTY